MEFPNDENGDVLRRMEKNGDKLDISRNIDFYFKFRSMDAAQDFVSHEIVTRNGFTFEVNKTDSGVDVVAIKEMIPTYDNITTTEDDLGDAVICYGGEPDGWGSIAVK
jgi:hypothetical protein